MSAHPLSQSVGALARHAETAHLGQSLETVAAKLRFAESGLVVVLDEPFVVGTVDEAGLAACLAEGADPHEPLERAMRDARTIAPHATGAEALRRFTDEGSGPLVVVDGTGHLIGLLAPSDLFPKRPELARPPMIGGMATPFGVYLTTGGLRAGASQFALVSTGMLLFTLFLVGVLITDPLVAAMLQRPGWEEMANGVSEYLPVALFLLGMRSLPLAGTHASEHMVVHAIERGEPLVGSVVARMPRVHPRCGTNLAVGASLFLGVFHSGFLVDDQIRLLLAALVTLALWRPAGSFAQKYITTKRPSAKQIEASVKVGQELLDKYQSAPHSSPSFALRIWNSGMLHVMAGASASAAIVSLLSNLLGLNLPV